MTDSSDVRASEEQAERLATLLKAATQGCLAFATYSQASQKRQLLATLRAKLAPELAVQIVEMTPDSANLPDLLLELSKVTEIRSAFFVYDVEKAVPDTIGYMNQGRELLASITHPILVWVKPDTLDDIARGAPDTWSWRSGVFDFADSDSAKRLAASIAPVLTRRRQAIGDLGDIIEKTEDDLRKLLSTSRPEKDLRLIAAKRLRLASLYEARGDFVASAQELRNARNGYERAEHDLGMADKDSTYYRVLAELGGMELVLGRWQESMALLREALAHYEGVGDLIRSAEVRYKLALLFEAMGRTEEAKISYTLSSDRFRKSGQLARAARPLAALSNMLFFSGDTEGALVALRKALSYTERGNDLDSKAALLNNLGVLYASRNQLTSAIGCFNESLKIRESRNDMAEVQTVLANLVRSHRAVGNEHLADRLAVEMRRIEDSSSQEAGIESSEAARLLGEYRIGEPAAYETVRSIVTRAVRELLPLSALSTEDHQDLIQDIMVKLWEKAGDMRPESGASLFAWIWRFARWRVLDWARSKSLYTTPQTDLISYDELERADAYSIPIAPDPLVMPVADVHAVIDLEMALSRLSERERAVIEMTTRGMSDKEIAHELGKSVTTVRRDSKRAFEHLRRQLVDVGEGTDSDYRPTSAAGRNELIGED